MVLWSTTVGSAARQQSDAPAMSDTFFKNVQLLKGIPVDEFMGTMGFFSASTGLNCTDCHVQESGGDWSKYADDNNLKTHDAPHDPDGHHHQPDEFRPPGE
jgi:hypothetical protein